MSVYGCHGLSYWVIGQHPLSVCPFCFWENGSLLSDQLGQGPSLVTCPSTDTIDLLWTQGHLHHQPKEVILSLGKPYWACNPVFSTYCVARWGHTLPSNRAVFLRFFKSLHLLLQAAVLFLLVVTNWKALLMEPRHSGRWSFWEPLSGCQVWSLLLAWPLFPGLLSKLLVCVCIRKYTYIF